MAGQGSIGAQVGNKLTVNQTSQRMAADWQTFSIDKNHQVDFVQPSAAAVALNRVRGSDPSVIAGQITANGQVFLVNPNGVLFTNTAQVNVGGLVASTLNISNEDFMAGRYRFDGESQADVTNQGRLAAARGGYVAMIAGRIVNEGAISAPGGAALLGAGQTVTLDLGGPVQLQVERGALNAQIANGGVIQAGGGRILLSAKAASELGSAVINQAGHLEASSLVANERGEIVLRADGGAVINSGKVQADGGSGGRIEVRADTLIDAGQWQARGSGGAGGAIDVAVTRHLEQTAGAAMDAGGTTAGGTVRATSGGTGWFSGSMSANASAGRGGDVAVTADELTLAGARLQADGVTGGGRVRAGGGWQGGDADLANARRTAVSSASSLSASGTITGSGGTVVVWSEQGTGVGGQITARAGRAGGDGGAVELSSRGQLALGAQVDVGAPAGHVGRILLDPKNIVIDGSAPPSYNVMPLLDPSPTTGDMHGSGSVLQLPNGNIVAASPGDDSVATNAGAVRLYRPDGTLLSTLSGTQADDAVGNWGLTLLPSGNYLVRSVSWHSGAAADAGAVTWGSGSTGVSGALSAANSLVGSSASDRIGNTIDLLTGGNYLVRAPNWSNGAAANAGAATWGSGSSGVSGVVSATNSLVGSSANDRVGSNFVQLANGNYLLLTLYWNNGAANAAGAVTWGDGASGVRGVVSAANSLVGTKSNDVVGGQGVIQLANSNYLIVSSSWDNGAAIDAGAVTWGSGTAGVSGAVSAANSLVGSTTSDLVGYHGVIQLPSGNYLVPTRWWDNGSAADSGAVTWGSGTAGVSGAISAANSLVGSTAGDQVGSTVMQLSNGNYLVQTYTWDNGAAVDAGALTWGSGTTGVSGVVGAANSLIGSTSSDNVGLNVSQLANGNYVARSMSWDNGAATNAGAVTWGSGTAGVSGAISAANSLVGTTTNDSLGNSSFIALGNGNYVVSSSVWDNGAATDAGAVTWGDGTTGVRGAVSAANSLVGSSTNDRVGGYGVMALANGNYVVRSPGWANGAAANAGAVTWGSGSTGARGAVSAANSLVGSSAGDQVGSHSITELANGNYVVSSPNWNNGSAAAAGAVTWGNGATGTSGTVGAANSLVGGSASDQVGEYGVLALPNGNYVVKSPHWNGAGASTWGNGGTGVTGLVSAANSLVGSTYGDGVGLIVDALSNGNYLVRSPSWNNGAAVYAGAVTWGSGTTGVSGVVSAANSLVGGSSYDNVGGREILLLANGNYLVRSPNWTNGTAASAGAVTWGSAAAGVRGLVGAANSLVGTRPGDLVGDDSSGNGIHLLANGNYLVRSPVWDNGAVANAGAVTWGDANTGVSGAVGAAISLVGSSANDQVGSNGSITELSNGNYLVVSNSWDNGAAANARAITWGSGTAGVKGAVSAANSLIGATANDELGNGGITLLANGAYLVRSYNWDNGAATNAGALTWGSPTAGVSGLVSAANSLVGSTANDQVGAGLWALSNGNYVTAASNWDNGGVVDAGAVTWISGSAGARGVVSAANSLVGTTASDRVGLIVTTLANGDYVVRSYQWNNGGVTSAGAVTRVDGTTGLTGAVSSANSFVGTSANDRVGTGSLQLLADGRLLVGSPNANGNTGRLDILGSGFLPGSWTYAASPAADSTIGVSQLKALLDTGADVTLQANNDITLATALSADNAAGNGGSLTLQAGRSILLNAGITTDNGNLTLIANDRAASGVVDAYRDPGAANITMANGTTIAAGTGSVAIELRDGAGNTNNTAGDITLATVQAGSLSIDSVNLGRAITADGKTYDGNATATVTGDTVTGLAFTASSNLSTVAATATFVDKGAANGKTVTAAPLQVTGFDGAATTTATKAGVAVQATTTADIAKRALTVTATGQDKVYDGLLGATVTFGDNRIASDILTVTGTSSFGDKHVGTNKAVGVSGISLTGTDAGNYTVASTASTTANITQRALTVTATGQNKVYDGLLGATVTFGDNRVGGDTLAVTGTSSFGDKHVGTNKAVGVSGIGITGADAGNYSLASTTAATTANITQRALTVTATGQNKVYDGLLGATVTFGDDRIGGDTLAVAGTSSFGDKHVGTNKAVGVTGIGLTGADAGNYSLASTTAATTANITQRALTVTATGQNKVYDGLLGATVTFGDDRIGGDTLAVAGTSSFGDKHVGTNKAVGVSGIGITGADAGNYSLASTTAATTANVTQRALTVTATGQNKVYDGLLGATVTFGDNRIGGDTLAVTGTSSFGDKHVGTNKAVGVTGIGLTGADAGNYSLAATTAATTANITPRSLTVTATGQNKVYDGTTAATASLGDNRVTGDALTVSGNASFADKNAAIGKAVTIDGLALAGADAGNYTLAASTAATTADITRRTLAVTATAQNKVYDGSTAATAAYADDRVAGDALTVSGSAAFADRNAGAGKAVAVTGMAIAGADAGNYSLSATTAASSADITPRPLDVSGSRTYDGSPIIAGSVLTPGNVLAGDTVTLGGQAAVAAPDAGSYSSFTSNSLVSSSANYSASGGNVSVTITAAPPPASAPAPAATPTPAPATGSVNEAIAATLAQSERDEASQEPAQRPPQQQQQLVQEAPGLHLQVVQGGIRMPAEATIGELRQEK